MSISKYCSHYPVNVREMIRDGNDDKSTFLLGLRLIDASLHKGWNDLLLRSLTSTQARSLLNQISSRLLSHSSDK